MIPLNTNQLTRYLIEVKRHALTATGRRHLVLGNEAADLDSIVSTLVWAYYRACFSNDEQLLILPVINSARCHWPLRRDADALLCNCGIDPASLIFWEDLDIAAAPAPGQLTLSLVDHNEMASHQRHLAPFVVEVYDHHADAGRFHHPCEKKLQTVGVTATLIAAKILDDPDVALNAGVARLLLGPILTDTGNLDPNSGKTTALDLKVARKLISTAQCKPARLHQMLMDAKLDLSGLAIDEILIMDHKKWRWGPLTCGISSVPTTITDLMQREPDTDRIIARFAHQRQLDLLLVMCYQPVGGFSRELIVCAPEPHAAAVVDRLKRFDKLMLQPHQEHQRSCVLCFTQGNAAFSRKKMVPYLRACCGKTAQAQ